MFFEQADRLGERPFLWAKQDGAYQAQSWFEVAAAVRAAARGLQDLGLTPGERVMLVSENRPEWLIADLAIMTAGGITVPAYTTNTSADHRHVLGDCGAAGVIVSTAALAARLLPALDDCPDCRWLVTMDALEAPAPDPVRTRDWAALCAGSDAAEAPAIDAARSDTACFIYTSGTGGAPQRRDAVPRQHPGQLHGGLSPLEELRPG